MLKKTILWGVLVAFVLACIGGIVVYRWWASHGVRFNHPSVTVQLDSTNLPIVMISTKGKARFLSYSKTINVGVSIIDNGEGETNYKDTKHHKGQFLDYEGYAEMRFRGNSSYALVRKKSYNINLITKNGQHKDKAQLLGMKKSSKWCLRAVHSDGTLMRDVLTCELARNYFSYVPSDRYCELVIDGVYQGIYLLSERVTKSRVGLEKSEPDDDQLTGGYMIEKDKRRNDFMSNYPPIDNIGKKIGTRGVAFQVTYPDAKDRTFEQMAFVKREFDETEAAIESTDYKQYSKYIDVEEFVNYLLVQEMAYNWDAYRWSLKLYKSPRTNGLFKLALWDFDYSYANHTDADVSCYDQWMYQLPCTLADTVDYPVFWWRQLMTDSVFVQKVKEHYLYMREHDYSEENITAIIDSLQNMLTCGQAINRNTKVWNIYDTIRGFSRKGESFDEEVDYLKHWISCRLCFMDMALLGRPLTNSKERFMEIVKDTIKTKAI